MLKDGDSAGMLCLCCGQPGSPFWDLLVVCVRWQVRKHGRGSQDIDSCHVSVNSFGRVAGSYVMIQTIPTLYHGEEIPARLYPSLSTSTCFAAIASPTTIL